jgi:hypothetical protein
MQLTNRVIIQAAQILGDKHTIVSTEVGGQDFVLFRTSGWVLAFWYDNTILLHKQDAPNTYKEVRNNFFGQVRLTVWLANQAS